MDARWAANRLLRARGGAGNANVGPTNLYVRAADGTGTAERLTESANFQVSTGITPDGMRIVFSENQGSGGPTNLRLLPLPPSQSFSAAGARSPCVDGSRPDAAGAASLERRAERDARSLLETRFSEFNAIISPDGRWLAYESNASGEDQIYVRPFPNVANGQWQISTGGGRQALWARSGRELFYLAPDGALMAVPVDAHGASWNAGSPTKLLDGGFLYDAARGRGTRMYDVSPDGQRFLMIRDAGELRGVPPQIIVVQNWLEELKRLVPTN